MVAAAGKAGKLYAVIQNRRYQPQIRSLRRFLDSGRIGRVTTVQSNFFIGAHFGGFRDRMQHVLLLDMAIHSFDQARLITAADAERVYCHEWNPAGSWYDHDASAVAVFEMSGGIVYTYQGSWCAEGCNTSWECSWRIIGERGSVLWDGADGFLAESVVPARSGLVRKRKEQKVPIRCPKRQTGGHAGVIANFLACVRNGGEPETVCTDNIRSLAMVHAAVKSAATRRRTAVAT
jgi:predicted dehydrogenase